MPASPDERNGRSPARILVAEDDPSVRQFVKRALAHAGYEVEAVEDGLQALEALAASHFDLLISDIVMPGRMDGLGLARLIKKNHPGLPILLATGYSEAAQSAHADFPILRKPYQMHELSKALSELRRG